MADNKRKFESPPVSYNRVPPPLSDFELAKQRAEQIAARLVAQDSKRSRLEDDPPDAVAQPEHASEERTPVQNPGHLQSHSEAISATQGNFFNMQGAFESRKVDIPNARVGVVIGKGGETIKYIQQQSGARIQITRDADHNPNLPVRMVELMGSPEQISRAEQLIHDVIAEADAGVPSYGSQNSVGEPVHISVPNNKVGLIIGRGGETIKSLQSRTGARIQLVPLPGPPESIAGGVIERVLTLIGTKQQTDAASELIKELVSENRMRGPPLQGGYNQAYRPPGPPQWRPGGSPMQQQGYGYQQQGYGYQQQLGSYPQQPAPGWDQRPPAPVQQQQQSGTYGYYNQQSQTGTNPADTNYTYSQPQGGVYEASYGEQYYGPPGSSQEGYGQPSYGEQSYGPPGVTQEGYGQQAPGQQAYGQQQNYPQQPEPYGQTGSTQQLYGQPGLPPAYEQPGFTSSTYAQQGSSQQTNGQPAVGQLSNGQEGSFQPVYGQPGVGQPVYGQHGSSQQAYSQPGVGQPVYGQQGPGQHVYGHQDMTQHSYVKQGLDPLSYGQPGSEEPGYGKHSSEEQGYSHQGPNQVSYGQQGYPQPTYGQKGPVEQNPEHQAPAKPVHGQQASSPSIYGMQEHSYNQERSAQLEPGQQQPGYGQAGLPQHAYNTQGFDNTQEQQTAAQSSHDQPSHGNGYSYDSQYDSGQNRYVQHMLHPGSKETTGNGGGQGYDTTADAEAAQAHTVEGQAAQS